jgi:hypothetical protein
LLACGDSEPAPGDASLGPQIAVTRNGHLVTSDNVVGSDLTIIGEQSTIMLAVTNTGMRATQPLDVSVAGSTDFEVDPTSSCIAAVLTVRAECNVLVTFTPTDIDEHTAKLHIASGEVGVRINLVGDAAVH